MDRVWTREEYLQRRAQLIDGRVLAGDASFKYAKVIRLSTGADGSRARPVYGIFTIMNEYDQVGTGCSTDVSFILFILMTWETVVSTLLEIAPISYKNFQRP